MTKTTDKLSRRHFLGQTAKLALASATLPLAVPSWASLQTTPSSPVIELPNARKLALDHLHTREQLSLLYASNSDYIPESLNTLNHFLRDHYSGEIGKMDPELFDLLYQIRQTLGSKASVQIISGYRSPKTNTLLRNTRGGGVAKHSLHMEGKAVDIRLPGVPLKDLRDAALSMRGGGVGFYPGQQFVHIDTGRVRTWQG